MTFARNQEDRRKECLEELLGWVRREYNAVSDQKKAQHMMAKLNTDMPMFGTTSPQRSKIENKIIQNSYLDGHEAYLLSVETFWEQPFREEKFFAIQLAIQHQRHITPASMDLYESMLRSDFVSRDLADPITIRLVGKMALKHNVDAILRRWIRDDNVWIRRAAILSQHQHKEKTNQPLLFELCRSQMKDKNVLIRKAIGLALREYSKVKPEAVTEFLEEEKVSLSALSLREASKYLKKKERKM